MILETAAFLLWSGLGLHAAKRLGDDDDGGFFGGDPSSGPRHSYPATAAPHPAAARPHYGEPDGIRISGNYHKQFVTRCELSNGAGRDVPIDMLIDTGATDTTVTHAAARALGVQLSRLTYNQPVTTASGREYAAVFVIPELRIFDSSGEFALTLYDVPGSVLKRDVKVNNLLGMSALRQVSATFENDELVLRA